MVLKSDKIITASLKFGTTSLRKTRRRIKHKRSAWRRCLFSPRISVKNGIRAGFWYKPILQEALFLYLQKELGSRTKGMRLNSYLAFQELYNAVLCIPAVYISKQVVRCLKISDGIARIKCKRNYIINSIAKNLLVIQDMILFFKIHFNIKTQHHVLTWTHMYKSKNTLNNSFMKQILEFNSRLKFLNVINVFVIIIFNRMGHSNLSSFELQLLWFHRQRNVLVLLFIYWETKYSFLFYKLENYWSFHCKTKFVSFLQRK